MTARHPRGTPAGGQFAPGRRPEGEATIDGTDPRLAQLLEHPVVSEILRRFNDAGQPTFIVGGAIRSVLRGEDPHDIDLCTAATPGVTATLLDDVGAVYPLGERFGTVAVNVEGEDFEVTTFRTERYQEGSRHPDVEFAATLEEDLARRDFTINAMALSADGALIDPEGGRADLDAGVIRAVGDPDARFVDDPLRIVRAIRFAAVLDFGFDQATFDAASRHRALLDTVSTERFRAELDKILASDNPNALVDAATSAGALGATKHLFGPLADAAAASSARTHVPPPSRFADLVYRSGVDPMSLVQEMKRGRSEMAAVARVVDLLDDLDDGIDPRLLVRRNDDATLAQAAILEPGPCTKFGRAWARAEQLRAPLPVNGRDIQAELGLEGRDVGAALRRVEEAFIDADGELDRAGALRAAATLAR